MFNPVTTCPACQSFADTINGILGEIDDDQQELLNATSEEKKGWIAKINELRRQLGAPTRQLHECEQQNGCVPIPATTQVGALSSTVEIWTDNSNLPGPVILDNINMTLTFVGNPGTLWTVTSITLDPIPLHGGSLGLKLFNSGYFSPASGSMNLDIVLRAHIDGPFGGQDSDIDLSLTTGTVQIGFTLPSGDSFLTGFPFDIRTQQIGLVGAGRFSGGYLDNTHGAILFEAANASNWPQS